MDYMERGSRARGVYLIQYTSRIGSARAKQEGEADTKIIYNKRVVRNMIRRKSPKEGPTSKNDLTIMFPKGSEPLTLDYTKLTILTLSLIYGL